MFDHKNIKMIGGFISKMFYSNYQNYSLVDSFSRVHNYLRISLTERCNLRCQYCMPEEGVILKSKENILETKEILKLSRIFIELGVDKIRLTGGEPLIRTDIIEIVSELKSMKKFGLKHIGITTNGLTTPKKLIDLKSAGLDSINISLDTLIPSKFEFITRRKGHKRVMQTIDSALDLKFHPLKINCVILRDVNDDEINNFIKLTKYNDIHVRFIEFMPFQNNKWNMQKLVPYKEILNKIKESWSITKENDSFNDTSKMWKIKGHLGRIGFITSMTDDFCSTCNRLRLTTDGNIKVCLFGNSEISLMDALRSNKSNDEIKEIIIFALKNKKLKHDDLENLAKNDNRPMILIGG